MLSRHIICVVYSAQYISHQLFAFVTVPARNAAAHHLFANLFANLFVSLFAN
mgnify:CR=1